MDEKQIETATEEPFGTDLPSDLATRVRIEVAKRKVKLKIATAQAFEGWLARPVDVEPQPDGGSTKTPLPTGTFGELASLSELAWDLADKLGNLVVSGGITVANATATKIRAQRRTGRARPVKRKANPKGPERPTGT